MRMVEGHKIKHCETDEEIEARLEAEENHKQLFLAEIDTILDTTIVPMLKDISGWGSENIFVNQVDFKTSDGVEYKVGFSFYSELFDEYFSTFDHFLEDTHRRLPAGYECTEDTITITAELNEHGLCFSREFSFDFLHD